MPSQYQQNKIQILKEKNEEMNISLQECHTVKNILDTNVILDGEVKEEIVMQEENNSIKNEYLPTNMTANVNVEKVRLRKLSIDEAEGRIKLFNLTLGRYRGRMMLTVLRLIRNVCLKILQRRHKFDGRTNYDTK